MSPAAQDAPNAATGVSPAAKWAAAAAVAAAAAFY
jgi:hypothetical protein